MISYLPMLEMVPGPGSERQVDGCLKVDSGTMAIGNEPYRPKNNPFEEPRIVSNS